MQVSIFTNCLLLFSGKCVKRELAQSWLRILKPRLRQPYKRIIYYF